MFCPTLEDYDYRTLASAAAAARQQNDKGGESGKAAGRSGLADESIDGAAEDPMVGDTGTIMERKHGTVDNNSKPPSTAEEMGLRRKDRQTLILV